MRSTISKILILAGLLVLLAWPLTLLAQDASPASQPVAASVDSGVLSAAVSSGDEASLLGQALNAVQHGQYAPAAVILLILATWLLRKYGPKLPMVGSRLKWFATDRGGVVAVFVTSLLGGVLHTLTSGGSITRGTIKMALGIGIAAIGGFTGIKRFFYPADKITTGTIEDDGKTPPPTPPAAA